MKAIVFSFLIFLVPGLTGMKAYAECPGDSAPPVSPQNTQAVDRLNQRLKSMLQEIQTPVVPLTYTSTFSRLKCITEAKRQDAGDFNLYQCAGVDPSECSATARPTQEAVCNCDSLVRKTQYPQWNDGSSTSCYWSLPFAASAAADSGPFSKLVSTAKRISETQNQLQNCQLIRGVCVDSLNRVTIPIGPDQSRNSPLQLHVFTSNAKRGFNLIYKRTF